MNISTFIKVATTSPSTQAILLLGDHGIGKSEIVQEVGKRLGLRVVTFDCSHMIDAGDILGLPSIKEGKTVYNPTHWYHPNEPVILFFDEILRSSPEIQTAIMSICLTQTVGEFKLAEGSRVIGASNPPGTKYHGDLPDPAQISRFLCCNITPTIDDWISWATEHNVNSIVLDFIKEVPGALDFHSENDVGSAYDVSELILPSRRSWTRFAEHLDSIEATDPELLQNANFIEDLAEGYVGKTATCKFRLWYKSRAIRDDSFTVKAKEVLENGRDPAEDAPDGLLISQYAEIFKAMISLVEKTETIPEAWKTNFSNFFNNLSSEVQLVFFHSDIIKALEDVDKGSWIYKISDDSITQIYLELLGSAI